MISIVRAVHSFSVNQQEFLRSVFFPVRYSELQCRNSPDFPPLTGDHCVDGIHVSTSLLRQREPQPQPHSLEAESHPKSRYRHREFRHLSCCFHEPGEQTSYFHGKEPKEG